MRSSDTWVCLADGDHARFFHCNAPVVELEPVLGFGLPASSQDFAGRLASQLDRAARANLFEHLVLVGPMGVLAAVEDSLAPATRHKVVGEVHRNLCRATPRELGALLAEWLPH